MSLIYLELACITWGVLIFLTTCRNSHGGLKSADGDAMLIALEVPARLYPSNKPITGRFRPDTFLSFSKCLHMTIRCKYTSFLFLFFFECSFVLLPDHSSVRLPSQFFGICTLRGTNCGADGSVGNFFFPFTYLPTDKSLIKHRCEQWPGTAL